MSIEILTFSGDVLRRGDASTAVVSEIFRELRAGRRVLAVVPRVQGVVAALHRAGVPAQAVAGGLGRHDPATADVTAGLDAGRVAVVAPGPAAGGLRAPVAAVRWAGRLGGRCRVVTAEDPGAADGTRYAALSFGDAARWARSRALAEAVREARRLGRPLRLRAVGAAADTVVGQGPTRTEAQQVPAAPLRVALLGLGTVGLGVYQALCADPAHFSVVGVAVRDVRRHVAAGVPRHLLTGDPAGLVSQPCDVVVSLLGGVEPARELIEQALTSGRDVVTANKAVVAASRGRLDSLAAWSGTRLRYSAAVGGAVPVLETVRERGDVVGVRAVLNGTCNYVLDVWPDVRDVPRVGIRRVDPERLRAERGTRVLRLVARATWDGAVSRLAVAPEWLPAADPLAQARGAENRVVLQHADGTTTLLAGTGAGREPTTTAVLADLHDLWRQQGAWAPPVAAARAAA